MKTILLAVTGSIAAYKSADLTSGLKKKGYDVKVVMTDAATKFITPLTLQSVSQNYVYTDLWDENNPKVVQHIELVTTADLFLVAPATANVVGKLANGIADDLVSTLGMAVPTHVPKLIAPAMNTNMYQNPIMTDNLNRLKTHGYIEIEPRSARLVCGVEGKGAMATIETILEKVIEICPID